jgi:hypothetical protein
MNARQFPLSARFARGEGRGEGSEIAYDRTNVWSDERSRRAYYDLACLAT